MGGHEHEVGVEARGLLVEVAGTQARDAAHTVGVVVGDLADLGVALEALGAVDDGAARLLQALGPRDVVLLVEAGAQLHEHGDVLALLGGLDEALAQMRALGHAVEGDLDRDAGLVGGCLAHQAQQRRHRLVRVDEQDVMVLDLGAHGLGEVDHRRVLGLEGRERELRVHRRRDLVLQAVDVAQAERHLHLEHAARLEAQLRGDDGERLLAQLTLHFQADGLEALAHLEHLLPVRAVVRLLRHALAVGVDVGAAGDADHRRLLGHVLAEAAAQA